jgi:hypothetical protein
MHQQTTDTFLPDSISTSFFLTPTSEEERAKLIDNLKNTSEGWDEIKPSVLKCIKNDILMPLMFLCNLSFVTGIVPVELKLDKVIPVYKTGQVDNISNYRPISILCVFSKVFERLAYNRLFSFLSVHNILNKLQFGFHKKHYTELALISLIDRITDAIERNEFAIGIFLDLS